MPVGALLDRYWRGTGPAVVVAESVPQLQTMVAEIERSALGWVGPRGTSEERHRRLALAAYTLELLNANYRFAWASGTGSELLKWVCDVMRQGEPTVEEAAWHVGAIALYERLEQGLGSHLDHAEGRFPADARWAIARAVEEELNTWPKARDNQGLSLPEYYERQLLSKFRDAVAKGAAAEAHLRWGYLELRLGRRESALAHFQQVGTPDDSMLAYWLALFRGRALEALRRIPEALDAYRAAVDERPNAQSATLALAAGLMADGRRTEARTLVSQLVSQPPPFDPWTIYAHPDVRFLPDIVATLRRAMVP